MHKRKAELKKEEQLKMPFGTASGRLRKKIFFSLVKKCELDICFRCSGKIESEKELSIEHKLGWQDSHDPIGLFFDLDNITFSHQKCNSGSHRATLKKYMTVSEKNNAQASQQKEWRKRNPELYKEQRRDKYKRLGT